MGGLLRFSVLVLLVYGGLLYLTVWSFGKMPLGFIPQQDQGYLLVAIQLPDSASLARTEEVAAMASKIALDTKGVAHAISVTGLSFVLPTARTWGRCSSSSTRSRSGSRRSLTPTPLHRRCAARFYREIREANVAVFGAPPVRGLGNAAASKS